MRIATLAFSSLIALCAASTATAQLPAGTYPWPNTGCVDGGGTPPVIQSIGGTGGAPIIPTGGQDLTWAMQAPCGATAAAAFYVWSGCPNTSLGPTFDWPTTDPFFSTWTNPPAFCGGSVLSTQIFLFDGALADGSGNVLFPFPLVDLRPTFDLVAISQNAPNFCLQYICVDAAFQLLSITQGSLFVFEYSAG